MAEAGCWSLLAHLARLFCLGPAGSTATNTRLFDVSVRFPFSKAGLQALNSQRPSAFPRGSSNFQLFSWATLKPRGIGVGQGEGQGTSKVSLPGLT